MTRLASVTPASLALTATVRACGGPGSPDRLSSPTWRIQRILQSITPLTAPQLRRALGLPYAYNVTALCRHLQQRGHIVAVEPGPRGQVRVGIRAWRLA